MWSNVATNTSSGASGFSTLTGYTISETAGAAAVVTVRTGASGTTLWRITLAANETMGDQFGDNPVVPPSTTNIYFSVDSGAVRWTAFGK
jgi:hypothetical protein